MAATALSSQLQALAVTSGQLSTSKARTKASLLFSPSQAADIDLPTIFSLSQSGLDGLVALDRRFEAFRKTLFSVESLDLDRELQSRELNDKLNSSIATFLRVLSSYILLTPAHQVLEYLIRRYKIHVYNVDDFVISIFPYHETSLFVRIVQLLQLKKTKWEFLEGVQKSGAAPPRVALVQRCMTDMAMLDALCEAAIKVGRMPSKTRTVVSFTSIVVMEVLAAVPSVTTSIINKILPFVLHSFEGGLTEEYRVGALMVVGTLANRTPLSYSLLETLTDAMAKTIQKETEFEGAPLLQLSLMVMIQLMQTQDMDKFPTKAFKLLVKVRNFYALLGKLVTTYDARKFLSLFLTALVQHSAINEHYEQALVSVINTVAINDNVAQLVTSTLELYMGGSPVEEEQVSTSRQREVAKRLLIALEKLFPVELDSAISLCLQQGKGSGEGDLRNSQRQALREIFVGTPHMPLEESNNTLYRSLDHPEARVREVAVRQLAKMDDPATSDIHVEMKSMMCEALLRHAHDDDFGVVRAVLSAQIFVEDRFPERVFELFASVISRCMSTISSGSKSQQSEAKGTANLALKILASQFLELHPSFTEQVASLLFSHLLVSPQTLKLNLAVLKLAGRLPYALYEGLSQLQDGMPIPKEGKKNQKEELRLDLNEKLVSNLAARVLLSSKILLPVLLKAASVSDRAKCLALMVVCRLIKDAPKDHIVDIVEPCLSWLRDEWTSVESGKSLQQFNVQQREDETTGFCVYSYQLLDTQPHVLCIELVRSTLYQLLEVVPVNRKAVGGGSDVLLKEMYVLLVSSSAVDKFSLHLQLLLRRLSANVVPFLCNFLESEEGSSTSSQVHSQSLDLLASYYKQLATDDGVDGFKLGNLTTAQLQVAMPSFIVGLASPIQVVRRSAAECLQQLYALSDKLCNRIASVKESPAEVIELETFHEVLKAIVEVKSACTSNKKYVATFLASLLNVAESSIISKSSRLEPSSCKAVVNYLVAHALHLSSRAQGTLFLVLQGTGHEAERIGAAAGRLELLLEQRKKHHLHDTSSVDGDKLSPDEVELLVIMLQMYTPQAAIALNTLSSNVHTGEQVLQKFLEALKVEGGSISDPAVVKPCEAALGCLTSKFYEQLPVPLQEQVFQALIDLSTSTCSKIHAATHAVLRNLKVPAKIISALLLHCCNQKQTIMESPAKKKRRVKLQKAMDLKPSWLSPLQHFSRTAALLEILSWLPDTNQRQELVAPLYELLKCTQSGRWLTPTLELNATEPARDVTISPDNLDYIQQLILISLERLVSSLHTEAPRKVMSKFDVDTVLQCVAEASDAATRNQGLTLLTAIAKVFPDKVLRHVVNIFSVIGTSTITQNDNYSHEVTQQLLLVVVPCWLTVNKDPTTLLQVIVSALPQVPAHRRMALVTTLLRVMKESDSLHLFLLLLLGGGTSESNGIQAMAEENKNNGHQGSENVLWEIQFAEELCQQYEPQDWLPALVKLLQATPANLLPLATQFVASQLQSLPSGDTHPSFQEACLALLEQVLVQLQSDRKGSRISSVLLLDSLTGIMAPTTYLEGMASLLHHTDSNICRKVLRLYISRMKMQDEANEHIQKKKRVACVLLNNTEVGREQELQMRMATQLTQLLLSPTDDASSSIKLASVEALEMCAKRIADASHSVVLVDCLPAVVAVIKSKRKGLCAAAVRCVTTILCILGPQGLSSLPTIISQLLISAQDAMPSFNKKGSSTGTDLCEGSELMVSILKALEAMMENMGAFLSPYLGDMISLVVLQPSILGATDANVITRAAALRSLIPEKIPTRLLLDPLVGAYDEALGVGENATSALFQMIASLSSKLDRASVSMYYSKIFSVCIKALDLRCNKPKSFTSVAGVETWVETALVSLVLKLSENSFKPLFVSLLEWAEFYNTNGGLSGSHIERNVAFYRLVNQLTDKLRSLFVPYFSYLLDGCVYNLTGGQAVGDFNSVQPKKKKKRTVEGVASGGLTLGEWHLRQLVLTSLHKCFLYDTVSFLDAPKFQQLLGPIVAQLLVEAPPGLSVGAAEINGKYDELATLEEMDDALVSCLGQMALTAGTDLLWKPLNYEVLMCSRSEKIRPRLLALRVVKLLAEQLKEEYLVLLPETLPFLAELLEDSELTVVAKTQEVVKLLEDLSGETLSHYF